MPSKRSRGAFGGRSSRQTPSQRQSNTVSRPSTGDRPRSFLGEMAANIGGVAA
ncbi:MAG: hypothetical protein MHPSP_004711, partial [Paramarteilia canceri]